MKIKHLLLFVFIAFGYLFHVSCEDEMANIVTDEPVKDITGSWKVVQLMRNGEDLSQRLNLTDFRVDFKADGNYILANELPFVLVGSGTYTLNDPQYPFSVLLTADGESEQIAVKLQYPVVRGKRQLSLSFSLGCAGNTYQYNFEREN
ncbi:DUF5004 domain-containing protein [Sphingobacterium arenae]|uniref:DUF5004 domain-containing protein n=1 Tax=Sphingobacterium arenae TaxID=1280598 RepID=A0ABR7XZT1_9SPHI|nr:DUF5004 domain-containing protein [Sphingobacterium arenae]MBD1424555.1 DUF5004 domain-containing protein [Sphingobacterium arenae]